MNIGLKMGIVQAPKMTHGKYMKWKDGPFYMIFALFQGMQWAPIKI